MAPPVLTAATADPVSWHAGAITRAPFSPPPAASSGRKPAQHRARLDDGLQKMRGNAQVAQQARRPTRRCAGPGTAWWWRWCTRTPSRPSASNSSRSGMVSRASAAASRRGVLRDAA